MINAPQGKLAESRSEKMRVYVDKRRGREDVLDENLEPVCRAGTVRGAIHGRHTNSGNIHNDNDSTILPRSGYSCIVELIHKILGRRF